MIPIIALSPPPVAHLGGRGVLDAEGEAVGGEAAGAVAAELEPSREPVADGLRDHLPHVASLVGHAVVRHADHVTELLGGAVELEVRDVEEVVVIEVGEGERRSRKNGDCRHDMFHRVSSVTAYRYRTVTKSRLEDKS
ncbi:MAG: hypothetical protein IT207_05400 [Fimbriimonadaceae bacterium]|nr:hypothetical protein [Fimbriimonadaceae bacterium]